MEFVGVCWIAQKGIFAAGTGEPGDEWFQRVYHAIHQLQLLLSRNSSLPPPAPLPVQQTGTVAIEYVQIVDGHPDLYQATPTNLTPNNAHFTVKCYCTFNQRINIQGYFFCCAFSVLTTICSSIRKARTILHIRTKRLLYNHLEHRIEQGIPLS